MITSPQPELMQCMEVWGGNQAVDNGVVMAGLDAWVFSRPFGGADGGGDVYYVSTCATNRILRLMVADVSGHGRAVQDLATELRRLMRRYVNHIDQIQFVRSMNQQFAALARAGIFATAVVCTFFGPTGRLTVCNAGHPPPLFYRAATRRWEYLQKEAPDSVSGRPSDKPQPPRNSPAAEIDDGPLNLPLGIMDLADYETFDVPLQTGDLVLCYTDSLVESHGRDGKLLGQSGLLDIARDVDPRDPATLIPRLLDAIAAQSTGNLTADDVTALLFRPNGLGRRRPSLIQQVVAVKRLAGAIVGSLRAGGDPVPWPDLKLANLGGVMSKWFNRFWPNPSDAESERKSRPG